MFGYFVLFLVFIILFEYAIVSWQHNDIDLLCLFVLNHSLILGFLLLILSLKIGSSFRVLSLPPLKQNTCYRFFIEYYDSSYPILIQYWSLIWFDEFQSYTALAVLWGKSFGAFIIKFIWFVTVLRLGSHDSL